jgi:hypothetical protein
MTQIALVTSAVVVDGVRETITPGLTSAWARAADDNAAEAALASAVAAYPLANDRLLAYAARNPPPQSWYDEDEDLF